MIFLASEYKLEWDYCMLFFSICTSSIYLLKMFAFERCTFFHCCRPVLSYACVCVCARLYTRSCVLVCVLGQPKLLNLRQIYNHSISVITFYNSFTYARRNLCVSCASFVIPFRNVRFTFLIMMQLVAFLIPETWILTAHDQNSSVMRNREEHWSGIKSLDSL